MFMQIIQSFQVDNIYVILRDKRLRHSPPDVMSTINIQGNKVTAS